MDVAVLHGEQIVDDHLTHTIAGMLRSRPDVRQQPWLARCVAAVPVPYQGRAIGAITSDGLPIGLQLQAATFEEGDWTGDGVFNHLDIVAALQTGLYLQGPYME